MAEGEPPKVRRVCVNVVIAVIIVVSCVIVMGVVG